MAGNAGADGIDVAVDLGVVGGFVAGEIAVDEETHDQQNDDGDHDRDAKAGTLGAGMPSVEILLGGGQGLVLFAGFSTAACSAFGGRTLCGLFHNVIDCLSNIV